MSQVSSPFLSFFRHILIHIRRPSNVANRLLLFWQHGYPGEFNSRIAFDMQMSLGMKILHKFMKMCEPRKMQRNA